MRIVIQRVSEASVKVDGKVTGEIQRGLLVFVGVAPEDDEHVVRKALKKLVKFRIFPDKKGAMNLSVSDIQGGILVVSQFTLLADLRKGTRPSFTKAAEPGKAEKLYNYFLKELKNSYQNGPVAAGIFAADMKVSLLNDGPVTLIWDL